jgi:3-oxoacyl-[acyl-carrier-protein] synthase II
MRFRVMGGGWVGANAYGKAGDGSPPEFTNDALTPPRARELFDPPLARYGRFDTYTKLGCAAVALALADAGLAQTDEKRPIGIVSASRSDCFDTDLAYHQTTLDQGGAFASPNLFSYTLPGIVLGECAVHFGLAGPTACVGQDPRAGLGLAALDTALRFLAAGKAEAMLAGWIEAPPDRECPAPLPADGPYGALFVFIGKRGAEESRNAQLSWEKGQVTRKETNRGVSSLVELFR